MKSALKGLCVAVSLAAAWAAEADKGTEKPPLKVLMIGNSFSMKMVKHLPPVARGLGYKADVCSLIIPGCPLSKHWKNVCSPTKAVEKGGKGEESGK